MLSNKLCDKRTTLFVCASPRRNTGWNPKGNCVAGFTAPVEAASSSAWLTMRLSRATRLNPGPAAMAGLLQSASELRLIGTSVVNLGQVIGLSVPTVDRNG